MKTIKNPKAGMIYHVSNKTEEITGILLSKEYHLGKNDLYYTFYTTENTVYEAYSKELDIESGAIIKENVRGLLKEYYQLCTNIEELENQQRSISDQKSIIYRKQDKIKSKIDAENGIEKTDGWIYTMHQSESPSIIQEKMQSTAKNIADTVGNIRNSWAGQNIYEKLNNFFDAFWDNLDKRDKKHHTSTKVKYHTS